MPKQFIVVSLLILLASACTSQVASVPPPAEEVEGTQSAAPSNTVESESTLSIIAAWTDLALTRDVIVRPTLTATDTAVATATAAFTLCPGAPGPYVAMGNRVTVVAEDVDKLKLRSEPAISADTVIKELNRFTQLSVVGGPVCVRQTGASYWFWQVKVLSDGDIGWVAEGDVQHSFIVVSVGEQYFPENTPTATTASACPGPHLPLFAGIEVTVIAENSDKLKLRSEPKISPDTVIRELDQFTKLEIVGGAICVTSAETGISYWLRKVKVLSSAETGWVAEGDGQNYFIESNMP
jgi:hypothetical protein